MSYFAIGGFVAAFVAVGFAPAISKRFGKKLAMIGVFFASLFVSITPISMRLLGMLPTNAPGLFPMILLSNFISATLGTTGFIIVSSMMADVVEDVAVTTGQRSEGLLFAANGLIAKCVTGFGTFLSGLIFAWVSFPHHATPGQVDPAILHHLGIVYVPAIATFSTISIAVLVFYDIDRSTHQRNLEELKIAHDSASTTDELKVKSA